MKALVGSVLLLCLAATPAPAQTTRPLSSTPLAPSPAATSRPTTAPAQAAADAKFYESLAATYIAGDWDAVEIKLKDTAGIARLTRDQQADVSYIKLVLAECHPAWWNKAKTGNSATFDVTVPLWKKTFAIHYRDDPTPGYRIVPGDRGNTYNFQWPAAKMSSTEPAGGVGGFTVADSMNAAIWHGLSTFTVRIELDPLMNPKPSAEQLNNVAAYDLFRQSVTSGYYGTPRARWRTLMNSLEALSPENDKQAGDVAIRPIGSAILAELLMHHEHFPSITWPDEKFSATGGANESDAAKNFASQFADPPFTVAEDRYLRTFFKDLADANASVKTAMTTGVIKLPYGQTYAFDPKKDDAAAKKRYQSLAEKSVFFDAAKVAADAAAAKAEAAVPVIAMDPQTYYKETVSAYMAGQWDTLEKSNLKNTATIAKLTKDQQADITYIKDALAECHPAWWNKTKTGKPLTFKPTLWGQTFEVHYNNATDGGFTHLRTPDGGHVLNVAWPGAKMDNIEPGALDNFTNGDDLNEVIWQRLNQARNINDLFFVARAAPLQPEQEKTFSRYTYFRGLVSAAYYGTPEARNHMLCLSIGAYEHQNVESDRFIGLRPLGSALFIEMISHPERYPSFKVPTYLQPVTGGTENDKIAIWAGPIYPQLEEVKYTLAEDKAFRAMVKSLADANADVKVAINTGFAKLPNDLTCAFDLKEDEPHLKARTRWLEERAGPRK